MTIGECGSQGDHGQHGDTGATGATGKAGATGQAGPRGAGFSRPQTLAIAGFVLLAFLLLSWRSEINASDIRRNSAADLIARCEASVAVLDRINNQLTDLVAIDQSLIDDEPERPRAASIRLRIEAYRSGIQPVPNCDLLPRP